MGCEVEHSTERITVTGGPLRGIDVDMNAISDTVQTLAAVALFADGPTTIRNVAHIRHKETDRIGNLAAELRKLGRRCRRAGPMGCESLPRPLHGAEIATYRDHRMAMSLALVGLRVPGSHPPRPAMHGEDLSELLPRFGGGCQFIEIGLMTDSTGGKGGNRGFNCGLCCVL